MTATSPKTKNNFPDLRLQRTFDAPRARVWRAWTDPTRLAQWWGPKDFTNPRCEVDVRAGGDIYIDMKGPDGTVYPMNGRFEEVDEPNRLVFISAALDENGKEIFSVRTSVTFTEQNNKTTLSLHAAVIGEINNIATGYLAGMNEGWNQSLDRLATVITQGV